MMTEQLLTIHEAKATVENTAAVLAQINKIAEKTGSTIVLFDAEILLHQNSVCIQERICCLW